MRKPHSFDIFDTILARRCIEPSGIFSQLERAMNSPGFAANRIEAERQASASPYTLEDIYENLVRIFGYPKDFAQQAKMTEIEIEINNAIPIRENIESVEHGDILITDMYLPRSAILKLLEKIGLSKQVGLVISCNGKHSGTIWKKLDQLIPIEQHSGDNPRSDIESPLEKGIFAQRVTNSDLTPHGNFFRNNGLETLARMVREVRLSTISAHFSQEEIQQRLLQINCNTPLQILTAIYLRRLSQNLDVNTILFSSRDCHHLHKVFEIINHRQRWNMHAEYFYTSRISRLNASEEYLHYFKRIAPENSSMIVDLCGTGWSLGQLHAKAGGSRPIFLLHDIRKIKGALTEYEKIRPNNNSIDPLSLITDATLDNINLELANYVDGGMTLDVRTLKDIDATIPILEHPAYPPAVSHAVSIMTCARQAFLRVLDQGDVSQLVTEIEENYEKIPALATELYRSMQYYLGSLSAVRNYHLQQDEKSMWKLRKI